MLIPQMLLFITKHIKVSAIGGLASKTEFNIPDWLKGDTSPLHPYCSADAPGELSFKFNKYHESSLPDCTD